MSNIYPIHEYLIKREERQNKLGHKAHCFWFTGLSGSGKSTLASLVERRLFEKGILVKVIDGDNVRTGLCNDLGFSPENRKENIRRISELTKILVDSGFVSLNSFVSPTEEIRNQASRIIGYSDFDLIHVSTSLEVCETRDVKGLYKKARNGEIPNFTGISAPYEKPINPGLVIDTSKYDPSEATEIISKFILAKIEL